MTTAEKLLSAVVSAELDNWVPGSSQGVIERAAGALKVHVAGFCLSGYAPECGPGKHCLIADWLAGVYLLRCTSCNHMTRN